MEKAHRAGARGTQGGPPGWQDRPACDRRGAGCSRRPFPPARGSRDTRPTWSRRLILRPHVIRYRRERWITPDGRTVVAALPAGTVGHFGPELRRFVLAQYHPGQVTVTADRRAIARPRDGDLQAPSRASSHRPARRTSWPRRPVCLRAGSRARRGSRSMTPAPATRA